MKLSDEPSPAPGCFSLQMGPISANKSPPPHEEGLIKHHRRYHQGLNLPFSIPLPKAHHAQCIKEIQSSLKCSYCQARQPTVSCSCAEWLLSFHSWLLGCLYSCCSTSVLLSRIEQGCAPNLGLPPSWGKKKGEKKSISNLDFL